MPDGGFKGMTPDPESTTHPRNIRVAAMVGSYHPGEWVHCDNCGGGYYTGDWPWCKGNPRDHYR